MRTPNAAAFLLLGLLMGFLPALLPAHIAVSSRRELWLEFMGILQGALGMFHLLRNELVPVVRQLAAWRPSPTILIEQARPGTILRPSAAGHLSRQNSPERALAA